MEYVETSAKTGENVEFLFESLSKDILIESTDYTITRYTGSIQFIQDTKTFPKCYVGRNGKRKQQKLHIQVCGSLKTQRNQGCHD